jgi:hypothetical protein
MSPLLVARCAFVPAVPGSAWFVRPPFLDWKSLATSLGGRIHYD